MIVLEFLKTNWQRLLGYPLAAIFCFLWLTKTCPKAQAPSVQATQAQTASAATKANVAVRIVYRDRPGEAVKPLPCPEIEVVASGEENQTHWQSQNVTVTPKIEPRTAFKGGLIIGGGYFGQGYGLAGVEHNHFKVFGQMGKDSYGGGLTYTWPLW